MSVTLLLSLGLVVAANLLVGTGILWLACKLLRVQRPTPGGPAAIGPRRALGLTVVIALAGWLLLGLTAWAGTSLLALPLDHVLTLAGPLLSIVVPFFVLLAGLRTGWWKTACVWLVWRLLSLGQAGLTLVLVQTLLFESFVVPTGAMAETILGHHKAVTCPRCGLGFPVNASIETPGVPEDRVSVTGCTCPNCRLDIDWGRASNGSIRDPGLTEGDRILVGKGILGAKQRTPERFDLVVFDYPGKAGEPRPKTPIRHVKRLIGLPGEILAIHRGDLFVRSSDDLAEDDDEEAALRDRFRKGEFRILRKSPGQILSQRHLVYDADHPAREPANKGEDRWIGDGWEQRGTEFVCEARPRSWPLRYRHVVPPTPERARLITDFTGYDAWKAAGAASHHPGSRTNWVGDLILECQVEADPGNDPLILELARGPDRFQARFAEDSCSLWRLTEGKQAAELGRQAITFPSRKGIGLRFACVDERLVVWIGDALPFGEGIAFSPPKILGPTKSNDLQRAASIVPPGTGSVRVRHLRLYRDVYHGTGEGGIVDRPDLRDLEPDDPATWDRYREAPIATYRIPNGHYFLLGDNSLRSADSRSFGPVAEERLLGAVLGRYFPLSRLGRVR